MEQYLVDKAPPTVYYIPDFITEEEEQYLIGRVQNSPKPKWEQLSHRRLQNWGGALGKKGLIVDSELPDWLNVYVDKIFRLPDSLFSNRPNHVLVNEYLPGQGIMPHTDGPLYYPLIATVSLGGHIPLDIYSKLDDQSVGNVSVETDNTNDSPNWEKRRIGSLLLERRSLVLIKGDVYSKYLHGIGERTEDIITDEIWNLDQCPKRQIGDCIQRSARISLTTRNIPKVTYLNKKK